MLERLLEFLRGDSMKKRILLLVIVFFTQFMNAFVDLEKINQQYGEVLLISQKRVDFLYQLMKDIHELFDFYKIEYWIQGGTLLGSLRHGGLMLWDDDIDINVNILDFQKILQLQPILECLGYRVLFYPNLMMKIGNGCWMDVFPTYHCANKTIYVDHWWKRENKPIYLYDEELYPLKLYQYGELYIWGPQNSHAYLRCGFGENYMEEVFINNHLLPSRTCFICNFKDLSEKFQKAALTSYPLQNRMEFMNLPPLTQETIEVKVI
jgi:lipopolysaccharide cholinephosphotransferase